MFKVRVDQLPGFGVSVLGFSVSVLGLRVSVLRVRVSARTGGVVHAPGAFESDGARHMKSTV